MKMEALEVFPCSRCGKTFDYIYALKRHGKSCGAIKPKKCKKCLKWFDNQLSASKHELSCFNDNTPVRCTFCSKTFEHLYMLQRHYRATHRIKMSSLYKKPNTNSGRFIDCHFSDNEERLQDAPPPHRQNDAEKPSPVYTIEIESISDLPEVDSNVQTVVYKIRQTTDPAEIELLPECVISDFDNVLQEENDQEGSEIGTDTQQLENYELDIKVINEAEYDSTEYYGIE